MSDFSDNLQKKTIPAWITLPVLGFLYFIFKWALFKLLLLGLFFKELFSGKKEYLPAARFFLSFSGVFIFSAAFLLNPVSYLAFGPATGAFPHCNHIVLFVLAVSGVFWALAAFRGINRLRAHIANQMPIHIFIIYSLIFLLVFIFTWEADIAYLGDECFHISSVYAAQLFMDSFISDRFILIILFLLWTGLYFPFKCYRSKIHSGLWICTGIVLGAVFCLNLDSAILADPFVAGRVFRYPAAQSWISALLDCLDTSLGKGLPPIATMRILPVISLFCLGIFYFSDRRWKKISYWFCLTASVALITLPSLQYYGTILYLELPGVFLLCVVFSDIKNILKAPWNKLNCRYPWFALIFLPFVKETFFPAILIIAAMRLMLRLLHLYKDRQSRKTASFLKGEAAFIFCTLGPVFLYMFFISLHPSRTYGWNFGNLADIDSWIMFAASLWPQFGIILIPAAGGLLSLLLKRNYWKFLFFCAIFCGTLVFLFCDEKAYIGMARFNLLFLPLILCLAWEFFTMLLKKNKLLLLLSICALLASNYYLSPLTQGTAWRRPWKNSEERWYPVTRSFGIIRDKEPSAKILFGNMKLPYLFLHTFNVLNWKPVVNHVDEPTCNLKTELYETIKYAVAGGYDVVVFRWTSPEAPPKVSGEFSSAAYYPAREGGLAVFFRNTEDKSKQSPEAGK